MGRKGRTVLVVDDDRINRSLLSKLLEHEGYEARTAVNGREALAALAEESFDAVLLDIVMPEVDGMEVLRTLKGDPRLWRIPVIVISAVDEIDSIVACLDLGADDYVQKPFDPVLLRARLNACLARGQFHDLEVEYQKLLEEQGAELEELRNAAQGQATMLEGEARQARGAVLVAGVDGLADLLARIPPVQALRRLSDLHNAVGAVLGRFGGVIADVTAGRVTVVFEGPAPADVALAAAQALGAELDTAVLDWAIGVALGDVALGPAGDGVVALGPAVERAVWLCQHAGGHGGTLVDADIAAASSQVTEVHLASAGTGRAPATAFRLLPPDGPGDRQRPGPSGDPPAGAPST